MSIQVALNHRTTYRFDRPVRLWPHEIRLRPAAHCRTPILSYSLQAKPPEHFLNWQQDAYGNWLARLVFPEKCECLEIVVDLVADMTVINPFDFFVEEYAENFPFAYPPQLQSELGPYLACEAAGPRLSAWLSRFRATHPGSARTIDRLVAINQQVQQAVAYIVRMEPGVQTPEQTLELALGSCRDSAWLLVQILRHLGLAARFASGYLIQLVPDVKPLEGAAGPSVDFTDLHAWAEVYIPGAGWIGLDPTSGLLAGEGHIPLACTAVPVSAAPVSGATEACGVEFDFAMSVTRLHEEPRVTKPYTEAQWAAIDALGQAVDAQLAERDVRLTMGGEPTFISIDDMDGAEWNFSALSPQKTALAEDLLRRLSARFAHGALLHFGQGKWYPGESLPRWALGCYWRSDGAALWQEAAWLDDGGPSELPAAQEADAAHFVLVLADELGIAREHAIPAYEDVRAAVEQESRWPHNFDPLRADLAEADERLRLARLFERGLSKPSGYVLPLKSLPPRRQGGKFHWRSSHWPLRREHLYLLPGDSPLGLRLPLAALPWVAPEDREVEFPRDPFDPPEALDLPRKRTRRKAARFAKDVDPREVVHTALCAEVRQGRLHVFMPPLNSLEEYIDLLEAVEQCAGHLQKRVRIEGYPPPADPRLRSFRITPDPGVIEVNIHPAADWKALVATTNALYEEARLARLGTDKFMLDGRHTGTGGGNHVTIGAVLPEHSPCLRHPHLLRSLIAYWQNHPALSYLFSGMFVGPTSQAPRVDEARHESLYELEIAFQQMREQLRTDADSAQPWLVDRLLRHLLVDLSGNTHRTEFCIDKLYSPDGPTGRLGLLEIRSFEMPPHAQMSLVQALLVRALIARFWQQPYEGRLIRWGTELHDRFLLPYFIAADLHDVLRDLQQAGYAFAGDWFAPFLEFRFPRYGNVVYRGIEIELRQAIEPWHVLGEEVAASGTARYVDSSVERLQVRVRHMNAERYAVAVNGRPLPLTATGVPGEFVAGVRYRAWKPPSALHPTIDVHAPLVFDLVDTWNNRSLGGCTYHVAHPGGRNFDTLPVNANEAEARRMARFWPYGHTSGEFPLRREGSNPNYPMTLDLRRQPEPWLEDDLQLRAQMQQNQQQ